MYGLKLYQGEYVQEVTVNITVYWWRWGAKKNFQILALTRTNYESENAPV